MLLFGNMSAGLFQYVYVSAQVEGMRHLKQSPLIALTQSDWVSESKSHTHRTDLIEERQ